MTTMTKQPCPKCGRLCDPRGLTRHARTCRAASKSLKPATLDLGPGTSDHPLPLGMATIEYGAFKREYVFRNLTDLQAQLAATRTELADALHLLDTPATPAGIDGFAATRATIASPKAPPARRLRAFAPSRESSVAPARNLVTGHKACPKCGKSCAVPRGYTKHVNACTAAAVAAPTSDLGPRTLDPSAPLSLTARALARCRRELADPATCDGRKAALRDEIKTLEAKLAANPQ